jgi:hypothetical protein
MVLVMRACEDDLRGYLGISSLVVVATGDGTDILEIQWKSGTKYVDAIFTTLLLLPALQSSSGGELFSMSSALTIEQPNPYSRSCPAVAKLGPRGCPVRENGMSCRKPNWSNLVYRLKDVEYHQR